MIVNGYRDPGRSWVFGLGWPEVVIILLALVLIFGPKKLPALGRSLGQSLRGFKDGMDSAQGTDRDDHQPPRA